MTDASYQHTYQIGDSVLATVGNQGMSVPGVISEEQNGRFHVVLAQPWVDDQSNQVLDVWLAPDQLAPDIGSENVAGELPG